MRVLKLNGHYEHRGKIGPLEGIINLNENGTFDGMILDRISVSPEQRINGIYLKDEEKLKFLKYHPNQNFASLFYEVKKKNQGDIIGNYKGEWKALSESINRNQDFNEIINQINIEDYIMKNNAEINISE
ncbi:MAG: hypothetical protein AABX80_00720 [Nanoarchaeota archaeon]